MGADMRRGHDVLRAHCVVGEAAARTRLEAFIETWVSDYVTNRDLPAVKGTSGLSENLTYGEISPLTCWHAGWAALHQGQADAEVFLKELVWREFAYHLSHHTPRIETVCDRCHAQPRPDDCGLVFDQAFAVSLADRSKVVRRLPD